MTRQPLAVADCQTDSSFELGVWVRPQHAESNWAVDREAVSLTLAYVFDRFTVKGFFVDPGSGTDDLGTSYWGAYLDKWNATYGDQLAVRATKDNAIVWDMRASFRQEDFTAAAERTLQEILDRSLIHDGSLTTRQHVVNARNLPNKWGVSVTKEHRESAKKIDLCVSMIGSRMLRQRFSIQIHTRKTSRRSQPSWRYSTDEGG